MTNYIVIYGQYIGHAWFSLKAQYKWFRGSCILYHVTKITYLLVLHINNVIKKCISKTWMHTIGLHDCALIKTSCAKERKSTPYISIVDLTLTNSLCFFAKPTIFAKNYETNSESSYNFLCPFPPAPPVQCWCHKKWIHRKRDVICHQRNIRELKHVGRQHDDDGNQYNESMKTNK
jgi:hypothetical protein